MTNDLNSTDALARAQRRASRAQAVLNGAKRHMLCAEVRQRLAGLPEWAELNAAEPRLRSAVHHGRLRRRWTGKRLDRVRQQLARLTASQERTHARVDADAKRLDQLRQQQRDLLQRTAISVAQELQVSEPFTAVTTTRHHASLRFGTATRRKNRRPAVDTPSPAPQAHRPVMPPTESSAAPPVADLTESDAVVACAI